MAYRHYHVNPEILRAEQKSKKIKRKYKLNQRTDIDRVNSQSLGLKYKSLCIKCVNNQIFVAPNATKDEKVCSDCLDKEKKPA